MSIYAYRYIIYIFVIGSQALFPVAYGKLLPHRDSTITEKLPMWEIKIILDPKMR